MNEDVKKRLNDLELDLSVNRTIATAYMEAAAEISEKNNKIKKEIEQIRKSIKEFEKCPSQ